MSSSFIVALHDASADEKKAAVSEVFPDIKEVQELLVVNGMTIADLTTYGEFAYTFSQPPALDAHATSVLVGRFVRRVCGLVPLLDGLSRIARCQLPPGFDHEKFGSGFNHGYIDDGVPMTDVNWVDARFLDNISLHIILRNQACQG